MSASGARANKRPERFHGAFTGGFSAGFYNTVGTAEGWTPSTFSSSRDKRAAPREQRPEDFMDDEDGLLTQQLQAKAEFDTLGFTAGEVARRHAERESAGGAIPGPAPSELVVPVGDPMGKKLLRTMGWREGQGVGSRVRRKRARLSLSTANDSADEDLPQEAWAGLGKRARELVDKDGLTFAPKNVELNVQSVVATTSLHGVGYDPYKDAPEFGSSKGPDAARGVYSTQVLPSESGRQERGGKGASDGRRHGEGLGRGSQGFVLDDGEDDVYDTASGKEAYDDALDADGEGTTGERGSNLNERARMWATGGENEEDREPMLASRKYARCPSDGRLPPPGFVVASKPDGLQKYWPPPLPPANFDPTFRFQGGEEGSLRARSGRGQGDPMLSSSRRGELLGEPKGPGKRDAPARADPSTLGFLSAADQQEVIQAASVGQPTEGVAALASSVLKAESQGGLQLKLASRFTSATAAPSANRGDMRISLSSGSIAGGLGDGLASRFTSTTKAGPNDGKADSSSATGLSGGAGLRLRSSRSPGVSAGIRSQPDPASEEIEAERSRKPMRSSHTWRPAPLLCKRLNVPVPTDRGGKDGPSSLGSQAAFDRGELPVPLLQGVGQVRAEASKSLSEAPVAPFIEEDTLTTQRPPIDLFKSIFESESESESASSSESEEEKVEGRASGVEESVGNDDVANRAELNGISRASLGVRTSAGERQGGYGSDSSEDPSSAHGSQGLDRRQGDDGLSATAGGGTGEGSSTGGRGDDPRARDKQERRKSRSGAKKSDRKRKHKHKHRHSSEKAGKKHRKHQHKRKRSSPSRK